MGSLKLDETLAPGESRALTQEELECLKEKLIVKNAKGVIFDLDGTLVDSMNVWKED